MASKMYIFVKKMDPNIVRLVSPHTSAVFVLVINVAGYSDTSDGS